MNHCMNLVSPFFAILVDKMMAAFIQTVVISCYIKISQNITRALYKKNYFQINHFNLIYIYIHLHLGM